MTIFTGSPQPEGCGLCCFRWFVDSSTVHNHEHSIPEKGQLLGCVSSHGTPVCCFSWPANAQARPQFVTALPAFYLVFAGRVDSVEPNIDPSAPSVRARFTDRFTEGIEKLERDHSLETFRKVREIYVGWPSGDHEQSKVACTPGRLCHQMYGKSGTFRIGVRF